MQFRVLGSVEVVTDAGDVVAVGGATQRRLLAALLIDAGTVVSSDRLCDLLDLSDGGVRTAVSRLRHALGGARVRTDPPGYRLDAGDIDAARFEQLCAQARQASPGRAVELLDDALSRWRGDAFAEFADEEWARPAAVRLAELRALAIEDRAEQHLVLGRYGDALAGLERHTVEQPLRDRPIGLVMRALAAQGRQAEALRAYQEHYRYLGDELGTQPSGELVELERRIAGGWHDMVPSESDASDRLSVIPVSTSANAVRTNLPNFLTSFVGRADDVARLTDLIAEHRLVTLIGPGGVGKTRLAVQLADELAERFPDGVWLVELASLTDGDSIIEVIASTLSVGRTRRSLRDDIVGTLRSQRAMLVLDNCEHLIDATADLAAAILARGPSVTILATSREALAVAGEQLWPVRPLSIGDAAVQLFDDRARLVVPTFELEANREPVEEICRRLDGIPLAIELAAARVHGLATVDIATMLDDRFRLLASGRRRTAVERQRTLRATVQWSYDLLEPLARLLFDRLSTFSGWFDLDAVRAVCAFDPLGSFDIIETMERLVEQSVVVTEDRRSGRRFRLLETLRQFGLERLRPEDIDPLAERHAHHYAAWIERLVPEFDGPAELRAMAELDDGWDNLRTAHAWAVAHQDTRTALRISAALVWEDFERNRGASGWAERAVELPEAERDPLVIDALVAVAQGWFVRHRLAEHWSILEHAESLCADRGWEATAALVGAKANHAATVGDRSDAFVDAALELARRTDDSVQEARLLSLKAIVLGGHNEGDVGRRLAEEALERARATAKPSAELGCEVNVALMLPDYHQQLAPMRRLLPRAEELRLEWVLLLVRPFLAGLEARAGDLAAGVAHARRHLRRLLENDAWTLWPQTAPHIFFVLVRCRRYSAAAVMHGWADRYFVVNPSRAEDYAVELATVAEHLGAEELEACARAGGSMSPRQLAERALAALDELSD